MFVKSYWNRVLSAGLSIAILVSYHVPIPTAMAEPDAVSPYHKSLPPDLNSLQIPKSIGKVQEISQGRGQETVIIIQDAHAIPDAQRSIERLIGHLQSEYGVSLVAVEGASESLDPQIFRSFPDKKLLKQTFDQYFKKGELTGSVLSAVFNENAIRYHGIEEWTEYEEGLKLFLDAMSVENTAVDKIAEFRTDIDRQKERQYSKELLSVDKAIRGFEQNYSELVPVLKQLNGIKPLEKGSELSLILEEAEKMGAADGSLDIEVRGLFKSVLTQMEAMPRSSELSADIQDLNAKSQEFQTSRLTADAFALAIKEIVMKHKIRVKVSKKLDYLVSKQKRMKDIQGTRLFNDFEHYTQSVKESLFRSEKDRELDLLGHRLSVLERLAKLELTRENWRELKQLIGKQGFDTDFGDKVIAAGDIASILNEMRAGIAFYHNAESRDESFVKNLSKLMKQEKSGQAIMIAGGFHAEGLIESLRAKNASYVLVMPAIGQLPEDNHYRDHMRGEVDWSGYFEVEDGKVNVYKAFVRSARDRLMRESGKEPGKLLKLWRDQIVRDLSAKKQIEKAGDYTRFIDEATEDGAEDKLRERWLANIDRFVDGLKRLEAAGQLTEQNIFRLLQPATIPELVGGTATMAPKARSDVRLLPDLNASAQLAAESRGDLVEGRADNLPTARSDTRDELTADEERTLILLEMTKSTANSPSDKEINQYVSDIETWIRESAGNRPASVRELRQGRAWGIINAIVMRRENTEVAARGRVAFPEWLNILSDDVRRLPDDTELQNAFKKLDQELSRSESRSMQIDLKKGAILSVLDEPFHGDIWIQAGLHSYRVRFDGQAPTFQRFDQGRVAAQGREHQMAMGEEFTVGRGEGVSYRLISDDRLSRAHFSVRVVQDAEGRFLFSLKDLNSSNGTKVDWERPINYVFPRSAAYENKMNKVVSDLAILARSDAEVMKKIMRNLQAMATLAESIDYSIIGLDMDVYENFFNGLQKNDLNPEDLYTMKDLISRLSAELKVDSSQVPESRLLSVRSETREQTAYNRRALQNLRNALQSAEDLIIQGAERDLAAIDKTLRDVQSSFAAFQRTQLISETTVDAYHDLLNRLNRLIERSSDNRVRGRLIVSAFEVLTAYNQVKRAGGSRINSELISKMETNIQVVLQVLSRHTGQVSSGLLEFARRQASAEKYLSAKNAIDLYRQIRVVLQSQRKIHESRAKISTGDQLRSENAAIPAIDRVLARFDREASIIQTSIRRLPRKQYVESRNARDFKKAREIYHRSQNLLSERSRREIGFELELLGAVQKVSAGGDAGAIFKALEKKIDGFPEDVSRTYRQFARLAIDSALAVRRSGSLEASERAAAYRSLQKVFSDLEAALNAIKSLSADARGEAEHLAGLIGQVILPTAVSSTVSRAVRYADVQNARELIDGYKRAVLFSLAPETPDREAKAEAKVKALRESIPWEALDNLVEELSNFESALDAAKSEGNLGLKMQAYSRAGQTFRENTSDIRRKNKNLGSQKIQLLRDRFNREVRELRGSRTVEKLADGTERVTENQGFETQFQNAIDNGEHFAALQLAADLADALEQRAEILERYTNQLPATITPKDETEEALLQTELARLSKAVERLNKVEADKKQSITQIRLPTINSPVQKTSAPAVIQAEIPTSDETIASARSGVVAGNASVLAGQVLSQTDLSEAEQKEDQQLIEEFGVHDGVHYLFERTFETKYSKGDFIPRYISIEVISDFVNSEAFKQALTVDRMPQQDLLSAIQTFIYSNNPDAGYISEAKYNALRDVLAALGVNLNFDIDSNGRVRSISVDQVLPLLDTETVRGQSNIIDFPESSEQLGGQQQTVARSETRDGLVESVVRQALQVLNPDATENTVKALAGEFSRELRAVLDQELSPEEFRDVLKATLQRDVYMTDEDALKVINLFIENVKAVIPDGGVAVAFTISNAVAIVEVLKALQNQGFNFESAFVSREVSRELDGLSNDIDRSVVKARDIRSIRDKDVIDAVNTVIPAIGDTTQAVNQNSSVFPTVATNKTSENDPNFQGVALVMQTLAGILVASHPSVKTKGDLLRAEVAEKLEAEILSKLISDGASQGMFSIENGVVSVNQSVLKGYITEYLAKQKVAVAA